METVQILGGRKLRHLQFLLIIIILLACSGCVRILRIDGPYEGKILDADTKLPLEGVVIHGDWFKIYPNPAGSSSVYYDSAEVLTDRNGEFRIPGQGVLIFSAMEEMTVNIFKAGYTQIESNLWSGLRGPKLKQYIWEGNRLTVLLKKMSLPERLARVSSSPGGSAKKQRLYRIERNKEMIDIGRPSTTLLPVE